MKKHNPPPGYVPSPTWPEGHRWHGQEGRCTYYIEEHGRQCTKRSRKGRHRCARHGGNTKQGAASGTFKNGKSSKHAPSTMRVALEERMKDGVVKNNARQLALLDEIFERIVDQLDGMAGPEIWSAVSEVAADLRRALKAGDLQEAKAASARLDSLTGVDVIGRYDALADRLDKLMNRRAALLRADLQHEIQAGRVFTVTQLALVIAALSALAERTFDRLLQGAPVEPVIEGYVKELEALELQWGGRPGVA